MKILHIAGGGDRGGAKTHILALCSRLKEEHQLKLLSMRKGEFADDARKLGIDTMEIQSGLLLRDFRIAKNAVREFAPDIVHCHGAKANTVGVYLKMTLGCTVITTVHSDYRLDYMHSFLRRQTFGRVNSAALRLVDYHVTVSDNFKKMLIQRGFCPNNILTIYNGLDFSTPTPDFDRAEYLRQCGLDYEEGDVVLGIAARLTPVKDIPTLLRAFAKAHGREPRLKLLIGGDGEDMEKLMNLAKELGVEQQACFCGWVTDIGKFFKACDIDVLCSISESFPYSILEGVKEHCAVITSDVGGMQKLIDHGQNGFIFQPGDVETFADYMVRLASDDALRHSFAEKLLEKASRIYSLEGMAARQSEIYRTIAARQARGKRNGVVICGAYGRGNSGDEAILDAIITTMRQLDPLSPLTVMTRKPLETKLLHEVDAVYTFNALKFRRAMRHARLFINGGGSLIQDVTSSRSLYFYLYTIHAARRLGCKVQMYGCGVGQPAVGRPGAQPQRGHHHAAGYHLPTGAAGDERDEAPGAAGSRPGPFPGPGLRRGSLPLFGKARGAGRWQLHLLCPAPLGRFPRFRRVCPGGGIRLPAIRPDRRVPSHRSAPGYDSLPPDRLQAADAPLCDQRSAGRRVSDHGPAAPDEIGVRHAPAFHRVFRCRLCALLRRLIRHQGLRLYEVHRPFPALLRAGGSIGPMAVPSDRRVGQSAGPPAGAGHPAAAGGKRSGKQPCRSGIAGVGSTACRRLSGPAAGWAGSRQSIFPLHHRASNDEPYQGRLCRPFFYPANHIAFWRPLAAFPRWRYNKYSQKSHFCLPPPV